MRQNSANINIIPPCTKGGFAFFKYLAFPLYFFIFTVSSLFADELILSDLIAEAQKNNNDILVSGSKELSAGYRIPQAGSLPDPMLMFGYENEGVRDLYTFNDEMAADSKWMFSCSQMLPYPGKLALNSDMASKDAEGIKAMTDALRLKTTARVKELYYELFLTYKNLDLLNDKASLLKGIEDAALSRYSTGMAPQQEVLMAQTEKYMLLEKEEMLKQKIQSLEAMLNAVLGRDINSPLGRPQEVMPTSFTYTLVDLINTAMNNSPEIKAQGKMIQASEAKIKMSEKEFYPDFTVTGNYSAKNKYYEDMWGLTTTINIPLFYKTKQRQALLEAEARRSQAELELQSMQLMISSAIRDNYSMLSSSAKLMEIYKDALIPKTAQDFDSSLSGYISGKVEAMTVISRLKSRIDYEALYWQQFIEREKAIARLEAITTVKSQ
ncbi:MAG: TolC family protein [Thermodesulfovibrionia bacterium]|nr:TolC family protein [Thermodesulfovibrionia bacterium]